MTKYFLPILSIFLMVSCAETSTESTTEETTTVDTTSLDQDTTTVQLKEVTHIAPKDIHELDTIHFKNEQLTDFSGEVIFYAFSDSVAFKDFKTGETKYIGTAKLNGKKLNVESTYQVMEYTSYYDCCDPWSEEEFCLYFQLVKTTELHGYIKGEFLHRLPEISPGKVDLIDTINDIDYSFYTAESFRGCYNQLLLIYDGTNDLQMIPLTDAVYNTGVIELFGEWVNIRHKFMRNDHPVVLLTHGVDGNYTYSFYEILKKNGQYVGDKYFETDIVSSLDEFDAGFDFDSVLHEEYKLANDGEDFPYN